MRVSLKKKRRMTIFFRLAVILLLCLILVFLVDIRARPIIKSNLEAHGKTYASYVLNDAVKDEIARQNLTYSDIASVYRDSQGKILSIEMNSARVNDFKISINNAIIAELNKICDTDLYMNIGTLTGIDILVGSGPKIKFEVDSSGYSETEIYSSFDAAGVNQTLHKILLKVRVKIYCSIPGYQTSGVLTSEFPIVETLIVGNVPSYYRN